MTLRFKYNIGDKVLLTSMPDYRYWSFTPYGCSSDKHSALPKEYEISGFGYTETADGIQQYYRLHAYCDELLQYHNRVREDILESVGETHPFVIESDVKSKEGLPIKIGDQIFDGLYWGNGDGVYRPNVGFTFAGHGTVMGIDYFMEKGHTNPSVQVKYRRDFLCTYNGSMGEVECRDGRSFGTESHAYPAEVSYGIDSSYPEEFAKEVTKAENEFCLECNSYDIEKWLTYLGVYDETMAKIAEWKERRGEARTKNKNKKPEKGAKDKKLTDFLDSLTEEQKEKLKEML